MTLLGNRITVDVIQMVDPSLNMTSVLNFFKEGVRGEFGQKVTQENSHVKSKTKSGVIRTSTSQGIPEALEAQKHNKDITWRLWRQYGPNNNLILDLHNYESISFYCFKTPSLWCFVKGALRQKDNTFCSTSPHAWPASSTSFSGLPGGTFLINDSPTNPDLKRNECWFQTPHFSPHQSCSLEDPGLKC